MNLNVSQIQFGRQIEEFSNFIRGNSCHNNKKRTLVVLLFENENMLNLFKWTLVVYYSKPKTCSICYKNLFVTGTGCQKIKDLVKRC